MKIAECIEACGFADLEIGDKVQIKHYHLYKDGYWQSPSFIDYKYLGVKNGEHHFQNVNYEHEHFRIKKDLEDNHVFIGRYKQLKNNENTARN